MILMPNCPCCGGGCASSVVVTLAGLPSLYYPSTTTPYSTNSYAMGRGFQRASDYNGSYRLASVSAPENRCRFRQYDYAVFEQQDDRKIGNLYTTDTSHSVWAAGLEEYIAPTNSPEIRFIWPGITGGNLVKALLSSGISTSSWPRGVTYTAGTDFTVTTNFGLPTSGWTLRVDDDTGQPAFDCTDTLIPWGRPTDADCCASYTGDVSVDSAGLFGGALLFPQYDDELELAFGTGANIRVTGGTYYTDFLTSGLTLTLKATFGFSVEYYSYRSHCPLPGWFYQGSINWERRLISNNSLFSSGTDTVCQFIVMPATVQEMFMGTSSATPYPSFVFNPSGAGGTDVPFLTSGVHVPYAARFSTGGDDCRAWVTKTLGATTLNFYSGTYQASLQSPGITVTQL